MEEKSKEKEPEKKEEPNSLLKYMTQEELDELDKSWNTIRPGDVVGDLEL